MSTVFHETPPPWYESVKDLAPGAKRRLGDGYLASFNGRGYTRFDFREKILEVYEPQRTLAEKLAILAEQRAVTAAAITDQSPPEPMMEHPRDWPSKARLWLHQAHLDNHDIEDLGAYWNPELQRVVIPYRTMTGEQTWTARNVGYQTGPSPKYLNPFGARRSGGAFYGSRAVHGVRLILTEDMLSAYRVHAATGHAALAVMGTSLDRASITSIVGVYGEAVLWLDGDEWGRKGARKIESEFSRLDFPIRRMTTPMDPKFYSDEEIRHILEAPNG